MTQRTSPGRPSIFTCSASPDCTTRESTAKRDPTDDAAGILQPQARLNVEGLPGTHRKASGLTLVRLDDSPAVWAIPIDPMCPRVHNSSASVLTA